MAPTSQVHDPHGSGLLKGGGVRRYRYRRQGRKGLSREFPPLKLSNVTAIKKEVPDFDPDRQEHYSQWELALMTEKILLCDTSEEKDWLNGNQLRERGQHEVYVSDGVPEPAYESGLYWRTHPNGLKWSSPEMRAATGCGFYRGTQTTSHELKPIERESAPFKVATPCNYPGCDHPVTTKGLCAGHNTQKYAGKPLKALREQIPAEVRRAIWEAVEAGEKKASIARRFGVSINAVDRYSPYPKSLG